MEVVEIILQVIGAIGVLLILAFLIGGIPMIPDLIRYMHIRNM